MTRIEAINEIIAIDLAEENWTDKEWMEDAKFITQAEYDAHKNTPTDIVLYPMTMSWSVE